MTRKECLDAAAECVLKDRASQYGKVENNFERIADLWEAYLHAPISALDVAMMMALLKVARAKANPGHADSFVDLAGYAACGAECASGKPAPTPKGSFRVTSHVDEFFKAEGCRQNGNAHAEPEFKPGDEVQARLSDGVWRGAVVRGKDVIFGKLHYTLRVHDFDGFYNLAADDVRSVPKAEGCEDLVFNEDRMRESTPGIVPQDGPSDMDAPQTPEAVRRHIVEANPAVFKPRTPTGEELAEMAEEDARG